jgi:hypothetical protein
MRDSGVYVSIQVPHGKHGETYLRGVAADASGATIRKLVTEMCAKPADFQIGSKRKVNPWDKPTKKAPAVRGDEDAKVKGSLDELVESAAA